MNINYQTLAFAVIITPLAIVIAAAVFQWTKKANDR